MSLAQVLARGNWSPSARTFSISYDRSGVDDRQVIRKWTFSSNDHNIITDMT